MKIIAKLCLITTSLIMMSCNANIVNTPDSYCIDYDNDGYGENCFAGEDCSEHDPTLFRYVYICKDADNDSYGIDECHQECIGEYPPAGFSTNARDCDDTDPQIHPGGAEHCRDGIDNNCNNLIDDRDALCNPTCPDWDGDGYHMLSCGGSDCDDSNNNLFQILYGYEDGDSDGYGSGDPIEICSGTTLDPRYADNNNDCDDNDPNYYHHRVVYVDNDGDKFGIDPGITVCDEQGAYDEGYAGNNFDCDDQNALVNPLMMEHCRNGLDDDCNGYIDENDAVCPEGCIDNDADGYLAVTCGGSDCDDNDETLYMLIDGYTDSDGDGYGTGDAIRYCSSGTWPDKLSVFDTDCDDEDPSIFKQATLYEDYDNDGYGSDSEILACIGNYIPTGLSSNANDCDDEDRSIFQNILAYIDQDEDYFGTGTALEVCSGLVVPTGYALNYFDCNDEDDQLFRAVKAYVDNDQDGYGAGTATSLCIGNTLQDGYVLLSDDCNDNEPAANPGLAEICSDGIDNNCNQQADEAPCQDMYCDTIFKDGNCYTYRADSSDITTDQNWSEKATVDVQTIDIENDGDLDLVWVHQASLTDVAGGVDVWLNDGNGNFTPTAAPSMPQDHSLFATPIYFNDDPYQDLVITSAYMESPQVMLLENTGDPSDPFILREDLVPDVMADVEGIVYTAAVVEDFDQNGQEDIFIATWGGSRSIPNSNNKLFLNQNGSFIDATEWVEHLPPSSFIAFGATTGDINNDGLPDVLLTPTALSHPTILINEGTSFSNRSYWLDEALAYTPPLLRGPALKVADVDQDNDNDLIVLNDSACQVWINWYEGTCAQSVNLENYVIINDSTASEKIYSIYTLPNIKGAFDSRDIEVLDFNYDGHLDIVIANASDDTEHYGIEILYGNSTGTFVEKGNQTKYVYDAMGLKVADLNNDGVYDIAIAVNDRSSLTSDFSSVILFSEME